MQPYSSYLARALTSDRVNPYVQPFVRAQKRYSRVTEEEMAKRLEVLRIDHRDLDAAIDALTNAGAHDQLQIARLKKRKLKLKDQIAVLEDYLIPDIIA